MKPLILFHREVSPFASESMADKWATHFGFGTLVVDLRGDMLEKTKEPHRVFVSAGEAYAAHSDKTWVWMDHRGGEVLDEFKHPMAPVVYAVGSDLHGFPFCADLPGPRVRLRLEGEFPALMTLQMLCYDRALYLAGRRR